MHLLRTQALRKGPELPAGRYPAMGWCGLSALRPVLHRMRELPKERAHKDDQPGLTGRSQLNW